MSIEALNIVFQHSRAKGVARLVLLSLADRADKDARAFCGANDLCRRTNARRSAVFEGLKWLRENNELIVEEEKGPRSCNRYFLPLVPLHRDSLPARSPKSALPPSDIQTGTSPNSGRPVVRIPDPNPPGTSQEPKERTKPLTLEEAVTRFTPEFPDKPVKLSLTRMSKDFHRALTPAACREWLRREKEAPRKPKPVLKYTWGEEDSPPASALPPTGQAPSPIAITPKTPAESLASTPELSRFEIDRDSFVDFLKQKYPDKIASWRPLNAPDQVVAQYARWLSGKASA